MELSEAFTIVQAVSSTFVFLILIGAIIGNKNCENAVAPIFDPIIAKIFKHKS